MKQLSSLLMLLLFNVLQGASYDEIGTGARATALANNHVALSSGIADCYWNPAALAFSVTREFQSSLYGIKLDNTSNFFGTTGEDDIQRFRIGSAGFSFALPASQGGMSISGLYSNPIIFDDVFSYSGNYLSSDSLVSQNRDYRITGNLDFWTVGSGIQVARNCGIGAALSIVTGKSIEDSKLTKDASVDNRTFRTSTDYQADGNYLGYDFRAGFMYTSDIFTTGFRLVFPRIIRYDGSAQGTYESEYFNVHDRYKLYSSYSGAWGITARYPYFTITAEARTTLPYDYLFPVEDIPHESQAGYFKSGGGAGIEVPLPGTRVLLRGGYSLDEPDLHTWVYQFYEDYENDRQLPIDWLDNGVKITRKLHRFSGGIGFITASSSFDISYNLSTWGFTTRQNLRQTYYLHRIITSFALRY